ncbi:chemotaxis protein CheC [Halobacillus seohaensis]|uniref:Chemotaxis protein CheC n=1 Tax=Halobacillus seohaensis TaxID=447421 RepID=A0ABW2EFS0_9BACI
MSFKDQFTHMHLDVLKEIGNIGAGNATTSLSKLLNRKIDMQVPSVQLIEFDEVMELAGGAETEVISIMLRIEGDAPGSMFFILSPLQAVKFVNQLIGQTSDSVSQLLDSEFHRSALQELGNIVTGAYLSSLSDFTKLDLYPSVPLLAMDMVGAILSHGLIELSQISDQAIVIETLLQEEGNEEEIKGHFFLFPDPISYDVLFQSVGISNHE